MNSFTPQDIHLIINEMQEYMFGQNSTTAVIDTSTMVSVGEKMLRTGVTNTLDALGHVLGRRVYAVRRYTGAYQIIFDREGSPYGGIEQKISFYAKKLSPTTAYNTQLAGTQLHDGQAIDPYVINKKYPLELDFIGLKTEQYDDTTFIVQLRQAMRSESDMAQFLAAKLVDIANDLTNKGEAENQLLILNAIGATYNTGNTNQVVNLTAAFNAENRTSYTTAQLMSTYLKEFSAFMVAKMKGDMALMGKRNELFHIFPARNDDAGNALSLVRHTPPEAHRLFLYMPLIRKVETEVFPSLFSTSTVRLENYEGIEYWQNPNEKMKVDIIPNQLNTTTGASEDGSRVQLDNVVALLFDRDAIKVSIKLEEVATTPVNARGLYYNTCYHWAYQFKFDQTENMILYYMAD